MPKPRILLDVDGVVGDFTGAVLKLIKQHMGITLRPEQVVDWDIQKLIPSEHHEHLRFAMNQPGFCAGIEPFPEAPEAVKRLQTFGEVVPVTTPFHTSPTWAYERSFWLAGKFGFDPRKIVQTGYKEVVDGDILIDDKPENVQKWLAAHPNGEGILWDTTYNQEDEHLTRAYNWGDVYNHVAAWTGRRYQ